MFATSSLFFTFSQFTFFHGWGQSSLCSTTKNLFFFSLVWQTLGAKYQHPSFILFFRAQLRTRKLHTNIGWRLFFPPPLCPNTNCQHFPFSKASKSIEHLSKICRKSVENLSTIHTKHKNCSIPSHTA